uniref:WD repeat-containing protein 87 n=1 Tax=Lygus hesperus TaxID=30085 RepID=A0A0A9Z9Q0_LYGHE
MIVSNLEHQCHRCLDELAPMYPLAATLPASVLAASSTAEAATAVDDHPTVWVPQPIKEYVLVWQQSANELGKLQQLPWFTHVEGVIVQPLVYLCKQLVERSAFCGGKQCSQLELFLLWNTFLHLYDCVRTFAQRYLQHFTQQLRQFINLLQSFLFHTPVSSDSWVMWHHTRLACILRGPAPALPSKLVIQAADGTITFQSATIHPQ